MMREKVGDCGERNAAAVRWSTAVSRPSSRFTAPP